MNNVAEIKSGERPCDSCLCMSDLILDTNTTLKKAFMALSEIIDSYDWDLDDVYIPEASLLYGKGLDQSEKAKHAFEYATGYKRVMWLVHIAFDYCYEAMTNTDRALKIED